MKFAAGKGEERRLVETPEFRQVLRRVHLQTKREEETEEGKKEGFCKGAVLDICMGCGKNGVPDHIEEMRRVRGGDSGGRGGGGRGFKVWWGEGDKMVKEENVKAFCEVLGEVEIVKIRDGTHDLLFDQTVMEAIFREVSQSSSEGNGRQ